MVSQTSSVSRATSSSTLPVSKARVSWATSCLLGGGAGRRGRFPPGRGRQAALQGGAGALERAGHRLLAGVEDAGYLAGAEPEDVAQDEDGALAGRQELQRGDERQRDGLAGLVPGLGAGRAVGEPLEEEVRVGLEPDHLAQPGGLGRVKPGRRRAHPRAPAAARSAFRQRLVAIRYSQVRIEERPSKPPRPCQAASRVSCSASSASCDRAEDPVAVHLQLAPVGVDELAERLPVPGPGLGDQVRGHRAILASPPLPSSRRRAYRY